MDAGPAQVEIVLVAVHHAGDDRFLAGEDVVDGAGELIDLAAIAAQQERLPGTHAPPFAAGVRLVPVVADACFAGAAVVEKDGGLADLDPFHRVLPLARMEASAA